MTAMVLAFLMHPLLRASVVLCIYSSVLLPTAIAMPSMAATLGYTRKQKFLEDTQSNIFARNLVFPLFRESF